MIRCSCRNLGLSKWQVWNEHSHFTLFGQARFSIIRTSIFITTEMFRNTQLFLDSISSPLPQGSHKIAVRMRTSVLSLRVFRKDAKIFLERLSTIISSISTFFTSNSQEYCLVNLINFYTMTEDGIADGFPGHMSRPEADATPLTGLLQGQASIVQLTQASLSQTEAFKNLKEDLLLWPDPQDERSDKEEPLTPLTQWPPWMPCSTQTKAPTWRSQPMAKINTPRQSRILLIAWLRL